LYQVKQRKDISQRSIRIKIWKNPYICCYTLVRFIKTEI
jgi:hypothetical protein